MIVPLEDRPRLAGRIARADVHSAASRNTRVWNPEHNAIGILAEYVYAKRACFPYDFDRPLRDGGQDFPLVDVKGVPFPRDRLIRDAGDHFVAPYYALVQVIVSEWKGRVLGHATREELRAAPLHDFGHGPAHVLDRNELYPVPAPLFFSGRV